MDEELRRAFANLHTRLDETDERMEKRLEAITDANLAAHEEHRQAFEELRGMTGALWRGVYGSTPPPKPKPPRGSEGGGGTAFVGNGRYKGTPTPSEAPFGPQPLPGTGFGPEPSTRRDLRLKTHPESIVLADLAEVVAEHEEQVSSHDLEIPSLRADLILLDQKFTNHAKKIEGTLERQNHAMGIGKRGWAFLMSREGRKFIVSIATLVMMLATAISVLYGAYKGHPPQTIELPGTEHGRE